MQHATTLTVTLCLALLALTLAPRDALSHWEQAPQVEAEGNGPLRDHHRAAQLPETLLTGDTGREPRATYGMITLSQFEVIANDRYLDWNMIRFLEDNLAGSMPGFAYAPAPQG